MSLNHWWAAVDAGQTVTFRPRGNSMAGLVPDRALVRVAPVDPALLAAGDVVLVRVAGGVYLHKVLETDPVRQRARIGNNRGGVNGWTAWAKVAGVATHVDGVPRPGADAKVRT